MGRTATDMQIQHAGALDVWVASWHCAVHVKQVEAVALTKSK